MITLELSARNWSTRYLQYNPEKWSIEIEPRIATGKDGIKNIPTINIIGYSIETGRRMRGYGLFDYASLRLTNPPEYCKNYIEIWD